MLHAVLPGNQAVDAHLAFIRVKNAGEDFDGGGLAGAIGADVAHHFAVVNAEIKVLQGLNDLVLGGEKGADGLPEASLPAAHPEAFA